ncbi:MAG TPA: nitrous oxide reductase family maturation protein NosD [Lutibacter sp.]|nr:nitrous oxide reductase family maturation protein NosD [Lutibacter sp.]
MRNYFLILILLLQWFSYSQKIEENDVIVEEPGTHSKITPFESDKDQVFLNTLLKHLKSGDTLKLKPGFYTGPATIKVSNVTIDGGGKATISGMGNESVIYVKADSVIIKNLHITNSGDSPDRLDAGIKVIEASNTHIHNNRIDECLFGVDIFKSDHCVVANNDITSISRKPLALKGDAIRLWYSTDNRILFNYWHGVRDMVVWYSSGNHFEGNKGIGNRYSIHFMYSHNNRIHKNEFYNNSVGIFLMYSEQTILTENLIQSSNGTTGMCIGLKETSSNQILNNRLLYSAYGLHFDVSPFVAEKINTVVGNEIAFCNVGMLFHSDLEGNLVKGNYLHDNLTQVYTRGKTANGNKFEGNYWSDYQGYDKDEDNVGDVPYSLYSYSEHLWAFNKNIEFFYGAPILEVLDFLERLAPFSKPKFVLRDKKPMYKWDKEEVK